jgi:ABC-type uncharacterized transport system substrate-binding protein
MTKRFFSLAVALASLVLTCSAAGAHPHVWVTVKSEIVYAPDGSVTGVRHAWTFDDMFSAFATQGLDQKTKGLFTREELAPLAEENAKGLKEFNYFTFAKADGKKTPFTDPVDYWFEYTNDVLTLHFMLPLKTPAKAQTLDVDVYDPTFFVAFSFADKDPVALAAAPPQCTFAFNRPPDMTSAAQGQPLGEAFFNQLDASANWGAQFASKISVKCP